jgi:hypothetical protein
MFGWAVPGLVLSVPGMLVLIVIGIQALGGLAWLPVARRRIGGFGLGRQNRARTGALDRGRPPTHTRRPTEHGL